MPVVIVLGKDGLYGLRNRDLVQLGGLRTLRNATLEDHTLRTGGGAETLGDPVSGTPAIRRAIDYWPDAATQRTVVFTDDGELLKDDGAGASWASLLTGLTVAGAVPWLTIAGAESAGRNRKVFYADGLNAPRVLSGDGAAFAAFANPAADWTGANQPRGFVIHEGYAWAYGVPSAPHLLYRSTATSDHEDFLTAPAFAVPIFSGEGEYLAAAASFKGLLLLWKYPEGAYAYDTRDSDTANWRAYKIGPAGAPGPGCVTLWENDVIWVSPFGGVHMISATQETGSVRAQDLAYRKLGRFIPDQVNRGELAHADLIYYADKLQLWLACAALGQTSKNRRLILDWNAKIVPVPGAPLTGTIGERWSFDDRDANEALFLRKVSGVSVPHMGDAAGQLWTLDRPTRSKDGAGYTFEWWLSDFDLRSLVPGSAGKVLNLHYLQLLYDPRSTVSHSVQVWRDGSLRQTIAFSLTGGATALPVTLPATLGAETMQATPPRRLRGQARRLSFRGTSSAAGADVSIAGMVVGVSLAGGT